MTIEEIRNRTGGTLITGDVNAELGHAYVSDLLSDVMGNCGDDAVLITIQNHLNTIAVATLVGIGAIVICHSRTVPDDMKAAAEREGVAVLTTPLSQFECALALAALAPAGK